MMACIGYQKIATCCHRNIVYDCMVPSVVILNVRGLLRLPVIFPQIAVCMAKLHILSSVGTLVQVTLVWLVVVGQLPQFDARML